MKADPGAYAHWPYAGRPKIEWPGGKRVAFWVAPNIEFYELRPPTNPQRAAWPHPYPAVPGYSIRDWGPIDRGWIERNLQRIKSILDYP